MKAVLYLVSGTMFVSHRSAKGSVWKLVSMYLRIFFASGFLVDFVFTRRYMVICGLSSTLAVASGSVTKGSMA